MKKICLDSSAKRISAFLWENGIFFFTLKIINIILAVYYFSFSLPAKKLQVQFETQLW